MKTQNNGILRYVIIALLLGLTVATITQAGNVIVKNGQTNVSSDFSVGGGKLYVNASNGNVGT